MLKRRSKILLKKRKEWKICGVCNHYNNGVSSNQGRLCLIKEDHKDFNSTACDDFTFAKIFYCRKRNMHMNSEACALIRKTKRAQTDGRIIPAIHYCNIYQMCHENCTDGRLIERVYDDEEKPTKSILRRRK